MTATKLCNQLESLGLFPSTLGGYCHNRETRANTAVFAHDIYEGFHSGVKICAAVIDLEDANNRVPLNFLMSQLLELIPFLLNWASAATFPVISSG